MSKKTINATVNGKEIIPIFFAVDDNYAPYLGVTLRTLVDNASPDYFYKVYVLVKDLSDFHRESLTAMQNENTTVEFVNVCEKLDALGAVLHLRHYYSQATYYRFFIPDLFPEYKKGIYLDCDLAVVGDISELYNVELGDNLLGVAPEEVMLQVDVFGTYVEKVLGVPRNEYFSAGVMLMNLEKLRAVMIEHAFVELLGRYTFRVTQDQDYLNVLCYGKVVMLSAAWNKTANHATQEEPKIIHYKINWKPWHYTGVQYEDIFWDYAKKTPYYDILQAELAAYGEDLVKRDSEQYEALVNMALEDTANAKCSALGEKAVTLEQAQDRLEVLERIKEYERLGYFDRDVENDPPTRPLEVGEADYVGKKWRTRFFTKIANIAAKRFFEKRIKSGELVIKEIRGIENYIAVKDSGALLTCNHFNAFDNYAIYKAIEPYLGKKNLYKIIREGNFTSYSGLYGFFFRHCNTLPLSTRMATLRELIESVATLLERGEKILIYPEQGMWWNYRKPRPLKLGAFRFAAKSGVPVVPIFITTEETDRIGADGFPILAYTVHILPVIKPDPDKNVRQNTEAMCLKNYLLWKETYESVYGRPLTYTTESEVKPCSI